MSKKKIINIILVVVLILLITAGVWIYNNRYELRSNACFPEPQKCMTQFAVQENDLSICDRMDSPNEMQSRAYCYEKVAISRQDETLCESEVFNRPSDAFNPTVFYKDECYRGIAELKDNELLCDKMINFSISCYQKVALSKDNITICNKARNAKEIGQCYYGVIMGSGKPLQTCLGLNDNESRFWCYGG